MTDYRNRLIPINADARHDARSSKYVLCVHQGVCNAGATNPHYFLAFGRDMGDALDQVIDWIAEHVPGLLANEEVYDRRDKAEIELRLNPDMWEEDIRDSAHNAATEGFICGGNEGDFIASENVCCILENPTRQAIIAFRDSLQAS
jgi:hypothetical protein